MKSQIDRNDLVVSSDRNLLDRQMLVNFLKQSYWSKEASIENILKAIDNSLPFGLFYQGKQIGFARVVTDYTFFAWLADVFVLDEYQRTGCGDFLLDKILHDDRLKHVLRWRLVTKDAQYFYGKHGFTPPANPDRHMERIKPI